MIEWHAQILRPAQKNLLRRACPFLSPRGYFLAGETAIALHLGHRRSADLDWFTAGEMGDSEAFAASLLSALPGFCKRTLAKGTLHGVDVGVKVGFLEYRYPLLAPLETFGECGCRIASLDDIAAMKLSAIAQRGTKRDFVDIYALALKHRPLADMLRLYKKKFGTDEIGHVLTALAYFDDADAQRMPPLIWAVKWKDVKSSIRDWVNHVTEQPE